MSFQNWVAPFHVHFVALCAIFPEARVHIHEELLHIKSEPMDCAVPVLSGVGLERRVQHRQNDVAALGNERHYVLVVPQKQRALCHLEVGRVYAARD